MTQARLDQEIRTRLEAGGSIAGLRLDDRRAHNRQLTTLRVAKLSAGTSEALCIVRNASSGGMMIDGAGAMERGQLVTVDLNNEQQVTGRVVWQKDGLTGVQFKQRVDLDTVLAKPAILKGGKSPRLPRLSIQRAAALRHETKRVPVTICD